MSKKIQILFKAYGQDKNKKYFICVCNNFEISVNYTVIEGLQTGITSKNQNYLSCGDKQIL